MPTPCRVPKGVKAIRAANALVRINVADFYMRNGSVGRLWTLNTMENSNVDFLICMLMIDMVDEDTC